MPDRTNQFYFDRTLPVLSYPKPIVYWRFLLVGKNTHIFQAYQRQYIRLSPWGTFVIYLFLNCHPE